MSKEIVEINGVKFEVDLSTAKKVQEFKVGDSVKVLIKDYSDNYKSHLGAIIGFDFFETRPCIRIAYLEADYSTATVKLIDYYQGKTGVEITPLIGLGELEFTEKDIIEKLNCTIEKEALALKQAKRNKEIFKSTFGKYFTN